MTQTATLTCKIINQQPGIYVDPDPFFQVRIEIGGIASQLFWINREQAIDLIQLGGVMFVHLDHAESDYGYKQLYAVEVDGQFYLRTDQEPIGEDWWYQ